MDNVILLLTRAGQVGVNHLADGCRPVREAHVLDALTQILQASDEATALRRLASAVEAFKDDEFAAHGSLCAWKI